MSLPIELETCEFYPVIQIARQNSVCSFVESDKTSYVLS